MPWNGASFSLFSGKNKHYSFLLVTNLFLDYFNLHPSLSRLHFPRNKRIEHEGGKCPICAKHGQQI